MKKPTERQILGKIGEDTATKFLLRNGFSVIERNYLRKWGEIDIVAKKDGFIRFVEVKTVTRENLRDFSPSMSEGDSYRPEDNVHPWKLKRLHRAIQTYLADRGREEDEWQLDVVLVFLDPVRKEAKIEFIENVL